MKQIKKVLGLSLLWCWAFDGHAQAGIQLQSDLLSLDSFKLNLQTQNSQDNAADLIYEHLKQHIQAMMDFYASSASMYSGKTYSSLFADTVLGDKTYAAPAIELSGVYEPSISSYPTRTVSTISELATISGVSAVPSSLVFSKSAVADVLPANSASYVDNVISNAISSDLVLTSEQATNSAWNSALDATRDFVSNLDSAGYSKSVSAYSTLLIEQTNEDVAGTLSEGVAGTIAQAVVQDDRATSGVYTKNATSFYSTLDSQKETESLSGEDAQFKGDDKQELSNKKSLPNEVDKQELREARELSKVDGSEELSKTHSAVKQGNLAQPNTAEVKKVQPNAAEENAISEQKHFATRGAIAGQLTLAAHGSLADSSLRTLDIGQSKSAQNASNQEQASTSSDSLNNGSYATDGINPGMVATSLTEDGNVISASKNLNTPFLDGSSLQDGEGKEHLDLYSLSIPQNSLAERVLVDNGKVNQAANNKPKARVKDSKLVADSYSKQLVKESKPDQHASALPLDQILTESRNKNSLSSDVSLSSSSVQSAQRLTIENQGQDGATLQSPKDAKSPEFVQSYQTQVQDGSQDSRLDQKTQGLNANLNPSVQSQDDRLNQRAQNQDAFNQGDLSNTQSTTVVELDMFSGAFNADDVSEAQRKTAEQLSQNVDTSDSQAQGAGATAQAKKTSQAQLGKAKTKTDFNAAHIASSASDNYELSLTNQQREFLLKEHESEQLVEQSSTYYAKGAQKVRTSGAEYKQSPNAQSWSQSVTLDEMQERISTSYQSTSTQLDSGDLNVADKQKGKDEVTWLTPYSHKNMNTPSKSSESSSVASSSVSDPRVKTTSSSSSSVSSISDLEVGLYGDKGIPSKTASSSVKSTSVKSPQSSHTSTSVVDKSGERKILAKAKDSSNTKEITSESSKSVVHNTSDDELVVFRSKAVHASTKNDEQNGASVSNINKTQDQFTNALRYHKSPNLELKYSTPDMMEAQIKATEQRQAAAQAKLQAYADQLTKQNDLQALVNLADKAYHSVDNSLTNYTSAANLYLRAAQGGHAEAQYKISLMYALGIGVTFDNRAAFEWCLRSAEQGYVEAQYKLGSFYYLGVGCDIDYNKVMYWYEKAAAQGHLFAKYNMAVMYERGLGVPVDYGKAISLYKDTVESGLHVSMYNLGEMYYWGYGVAQDYRKAFYYYREGAKYGCVTAQYSLGYMYEKGLGVNKNIQRSLFWYIKAAKQNHAMSQLKLGLMYLHGENVDVDYGKAENWLELSASQGNANAQYQMGMMAQHGLGSTVKLGSSDYAKAKGWYELAAVQGHALSELRLGEFYYWGIVNDKNYKQAFRYFERAAKKGEIEAQLYVAMMFASGQGIEQNYEQALKWYQIAAARNDRSAQYALGLIYALGYGVERNDIKARDWFGKSAQQGDSAAQYQLGLMWLRGRGGNSSFNQAFNWFALSAEQNNARAQQQLGLCYLRGIGVNKDYTQARYWFEKAALQGHADAFYQLGLVYENGLGVAANDGYAKVCQQEGCMRGSNTACRRLREYIQVGQMVDLPSELVSNSMTVESMTTNEANLENEARSAANYTSSPNTFPQNNTSL